MRGYGALTLKPMCVLKLASTSLLILARFSACRGLALLWIVGTFMTAGVLAEATSGDGDPPGDTSTAQVVDDGPRFLVSAFEIVYQPEHPGLPDIDQVLAAPMTLAVRNGCYAAPRPGEEVIEFTLGQADRLDLPCFSASALQSINQQVVRYLNQVGVTGVYVSPAAEDIPERSMKYGPLRLNVEVAVVKAVRTVTSGDAGDAQDNINHERHAWIAAGSPVQPLDDAAVEEGLIRQSLLERYLYRLNRHPGRRVDVKLGVAEQEGGVALEYLVHESRPWSALFQISNTGTKSTNEWRERFSLVHNQFTGNDDILSLTYATAGFDESHAFVGSYEAPVGDNDWLRWQVNGAWSEFQASDLGVDNVFTGDSWSVGGQLIANIFQHRDLFVDVYAGVRWQNLHVRNTQLQAFGVITEGADDFFLPGVGVTVQRATARANTFGSIGFEWNLPGVADTSETQIVRLGRTGVEDSWTVLVLNLQHSFYLEPVLNRQAFDDASDPTWSTLAHELALSLRGQYAFDDRLVPQFQQVAGGLYSVRGYRQSLTTGDSALIGSIEYRYHVPRSFTPSAEPGELFGQSFRYVPKEPYGQADWDLIFRAFIDAARTVQSDRISGVESNETLVGAGVGTELWFKRNFSVRLDFAWALRDAAETEGGDSRLHVAATWLY